MRVIKSERHLMDALVSLCCASPSSPELRNVCSQRFSEQSIALTFRPFQLMYKQLLDIADIIDNLDSESPHTMPLRYFHARFLLEHNRHVLCMAARSSTLIQLSSSLLDRCRLVDVLRTALCDPSSIPQILERVHTARFAHAATVDALHQAFKEPYVLVMKKWLEIHDAESCDDPFVPEWLQGEVNWKQLCQLGRTNSVLRRIGRDPAKACLLQVMRVDYALFDVIDQLHECFFLPDGTLDYPICLCITQKHIAVYHEIKRIFEQLNDHRCSLKCAPASPRRFLGMTVINAIFHVFTTRLAVYSFADSVDDSDFASLVARYDRFCSNVKRSMFLEFPALRNELLSVSRSAADWQSTGVRSLLSMVGDRSRLKTMLKAVDLIDLLPI